MKWSYICHDVNGANNHGAYNHGADNHGYSKTVFLPGVIDGVVVTTGMVDTVVLTLGVVNTSSQLRPLSMLPPGPLYSSEQLGHFHPGLQ